MVLIRGSKESTTGSIQQSACSQRAIVRLWTPAPWGDIDVEEDRLLWTIPNSVRMTRTVQNIEESVNALVSNPCTQQATEPEGEVPITEPIEVSRLLKAIHPLYCIDILFLRGANQMHDKRTVAVDTTDRPEAHCIAIP